MDQANQEIKPRLGREDIGKAIEGLSLRGDLSKRELRVCLFLLTHYNFSKGLWPYFSQRSLGRILNIDESNLSKVIDQLHEKKLLKKPEKSTQRCRRGDPPNEREMQVNHLVLADLAKSTNWSKRPVDVDENWSKQPVDVDENWSKQPAETGQNDQSKLVKTTNKPIEREPIEIEPESPLPPLLFEDDPAVEFVEGEIVSAQEVAFDAWNAMAKEHGLPVAKTLDQKRKAALRRTLQNVGEDGWQEAVNKVAASEFLKGASNSGWKATLDWLLKPQNIAKVLEQNYANRPGRSRNADLFAEGAAALAERLAARHQSTGDGSGD